MCFGFADAHPDTYALSRFPSPAVPRPPHRDGVEQEPGDAHPFVPQKISDFSVSYGSLFGFRFRRFFFVECDLRLFWGSSELRKSD